MGLMDSGPRRETPNETERMESALLHVARALQAGPCTFGKLRYRLETPQQFGSGSLPHPLTLPLGLSLDQVVNRGLIDEWFIKDAQNIFKLTYLGWQASNGVLGVPVFGHPEKWPAS